MGQQRFVGMGINTLRPLTVPIAPDLSACNHTLWVHVISSGFYLATPHKSWQVWLNWQFLLLLLLWFPLSLLWETLPGFISPDNTNSWITGTCKPLGDLNASNQSEFTL